MSIHAYCTLFPPNKYFTSLLSISVEILSCKAEWPGLLSLTTSLMARIQCFHCCDPAQFLAPKPQSRPLQAEATQDQDEAFVQVKLLFWRCSELVFLSRRCLTEAAPKALRSKMDVNKVKRMISSYWVEFPLSLCTKPPWPT